MARADGAQSPRAPLPLEGLRVLDLATFVAAPFATTTLAEFGAEVIKVEQPGAGDPWRRYGTVKDGGDTLAWKSEARNKRSLTLDLRKPEGADILKRLAARSDVLAENFRPGTLERWGLGPETLLAENPRLVILRVSGYGQDGPYRDRPGFARIAHAFAGLAHLAGLPDGPPVTPGSTSLADYVTGLYGAVAILIALKARERTGRGQVIDLSLYESIFRLLDELAPAYAQAGIVRGREGTRTLNACPHGHYRARDGQWLALACTSDRMFARLCEMMERPELAAADAYGPVARRLAAYETVDGIVADYVAGFDRDAFIARCVAFDVPAGPINTIADIFADPHVKVRGTLLEMADEAGRAVTIPNVVPRLSDTPGRVERLGPPLGEANKHVLCDLLDFSAADVARLEAAGII